MNDFIIRMAVKEDAEAIQKIYEPYIKKTAITFEYVPITLEQFQKRMDKIQAEFPWLVYESGGKIIGYAYASRYRERAAFDWDCESSVYVAEGEHRRGVATSLYHELLKLLTLQGFYNVYAFITVPSEGSVAFHKSAGFTEVGTFHKTGYKMGRWWDLTVMEKALRTFEEAPGIIENYKLYI